MTTVPQVQITARDYYVLTKGLSLDAAISLVAVFYYESKLNPGSQGYQTTETPGVLNPHGAYGIMSLNGLRQQDLLNFATKHDLPVDNLETQLAFALTDMANSYPSSWSAIRSMASYKAIIPILVDEYENPKNKPAEIAGALAIAAALSALPPPKPAPQPAPQAPLPQVPAPQVPIPASPTPAAPAGLPPISATTAGRRAAEQSRIGSILDELFAEQAALAEEIAAFQQMADSLSKLNPAPTAPPLPAPPAIPAIPAEPTAQGGIQMPAIITHILTNYMTSAAGTVVGGPAILDIVHGLTGGGVTAVNWNQDIPQLATMIVGWLAPDPKTATTPK